MIQVQLLPEEFRGQMKPWAGIKLSDAGGNPIDLVGSVALSVRYKEKVTEMSSIAIVSACPYPMLLGSDYLDEVGGFINCKTGE